MISDINFKNLFVEKVENKKSNKKSCKNTQIQTRPLIQKLVKL